MTSVTGESMMKHILAMATFAVAMAGAGHAGAFKFADGATVQCIARGEVATEIYAEPSDPFKPQNRTALAEQTPNGWQITWNVERLKGLPPEVRDFLFFHECAHIRVPTEVELTANCAGLKDMRAAGRAGPAFEARLRQFFPPDNEYWNETFRCANGEAAPPSAPTPAG